MSVAATTSVEIHTCPQDVPSLPAWFGEVTSLAHHLTRHGVFDALCEQVHLSRGRMGHYEVIDFLAVLFGYAISGERTLAALFERAAPFAGPFMALFGREHLPHRCTLSRFLAACRPPMWCSSTCIAAPSRRCSPMKMSSKTRVAGVRTPHVDRSAGRSSRSGSGICVWSWAAGSRQPQLRHKRLLDDTVLPDTAMPAARPVLLTSRRGGFCEASQGRARSRSPELARAPGPQYAHREQPALSHHAFRGGPTGRCLSQPGLSLCWG